MKTKSRPQYYRIRRCDGHSRHAVSHSTSFEDHALLVPALVLGRAAWFFLHTEASNKHEQTHFPARNNPEESLNKGEQSVSSEAIAQASEFH